MSKYRALFFDLDHTLWDYETNSSETLNDLYQDFDLASYIGNSASKFVDTFNKVNNSLWGEYNKGTIDRQHIKEKRFDNIFRRMGASAPSLSQELSIEYIKRCPQKTNLMPHTMDVLDYLSNNYPLYLLTNGFDDVQTIKLETSKLDIYFDGMVTSETCGHRKPSAEIFEYTLNQAKTTAVETLMIGDNLMADIRGAKKANLDSVYYNPSGRPHKEDTDYEISCLSELKSIL